MRKHPKMKLREMVHQPIVAHEPAADSLLTELERMAAESCWGLGSLFDPKGDKLRWNAICQPRVGKIEAIPHKPDEWIAWVEEFYSRANEFEWATEFKNGIPVIWDGEGEVTIDSPHLSATVMYWEGRPLHQYKEADANYDYTFRNPYLRRVAEWVKHAIVKAQMNGRWVDTRSPMIRPKSTDKLWKKQTLLPWKIIECKWDDKNESFILRLEPVLPLIGYDEQMTVGKYVFGGISSLFGMMASYEMQISESIMTDIFPGVEDEDYIGKTIIQFTSEDSVGKWRRMKFEDEPVYLWDLPPDDPHNCIVALQLFESNESPLLQNHLWKVKEMDFHTEGWGANKRERVLKDMRYGNRWEFLKKCNGTVDGFLYPSLYHAIQDTMSTYIFNNLSTPGDPSLDEEWGESSRFVHPWLDKRPVKVIDNVKGGVAYWSDVVRCKICNGRVKVLLKENPIKIKFDCPHCSESGCIDCTHCQPDVDWPDDKRRKVVRAK